MDGRMAGWMDMWKTKRRRKGNKEECRREG